MIVEVFTCRIVLLLKIYDIIIIRLSFTWNLSFRFKALEKTNENIDWQEDLFEILFSDIHLFFSSSYINIVVFLHEFSAKSALFNTGIRKTTTNKTVHCVRTLSTTSFWIVEWEKKCFLSSFNNIMSLSNSNEYENSSKTIFDWAITRLDCLIFP